MNRRHLAWASLLLIPLVLVGLRIAVNWKPPNAPPEPAANPPQKNGAGKTVVAAGTPADDRSVRPPGFEPVEQTVSVSAGSDAAATQLHLAAGQTLEISCRIARPSQLPANARLRAAWRLRDADSPNAFPWQAEASAGKPAPDDRVPDDQALEIYTRPTPDWSKLLHALDGDLYLVYRAPVAGTYELSLEPEEGEIDLFEGTRWRETGKIAQHAAAPRQVPWPSGTTVDVELSVRPLTLLDGAEQRLIVEAEPNDTPEQAIPIPLPETSADYTLHVVGGSDDIEYFDNGRVGQSGDDWYRLDFGGSDRRLLTACLSIPDQQVAARIRCYTLSAARADVPAGRLLPLTKEYTAGKNINERPHQQPESHRIAINRTLRPNNVYFLRVEANAPGYELELRVVQPAPFDDPRRAIRHALYDHLGQVDSWLANRPRSISVERRIRDTGNLLGTGCMSCHTQAGVWGPAIPLAQGYRPQNVQLMRNLANICYQSMRPTNELVDAANNASLAPLDLGDGPAGTRVAGHAVVAYERYRKPRKLQSMQAIRAANNVLQTSDPSAVNAAGPGANVGEAVVLNYAAEVVWSAWKATGDPKYFRALEDKARRLLDVKPKFTDDLCHRVEMLSRYFPADYVEQAAEVARREAALTEPLSRVPYESTPTTPKEAAELRQRVDRQVAEDVERLRAVQNDDGSWGFNPGKPSEEGSGWRIVGANPGEPSPTALALIALESRGLRDQDPAVARGVRALLQLQKPSGYWKGASLTGFVSTAYALNALARLYPTEPPVYVPQDFQPEPDESLSATIRRVRDLSTTEKPELAPLMVQAAEHPSPLVRYWAMIGLGGIPRHAPVEPLVSGLGDPAKLVREAAHWALRQVLIDDRGWSEVLAAMESDDDYTREAAARALLMRVDGVLPEISADWSELAGALARGMNQDPHPAVRAWAVRAAWNWWYWNPPLREPINRAWLELLQREEPNALVENALRYQTHALFIVNGHHANESKTHQYRELADLFAGLQERLESDAEARPEQENSAKVRRARLVRRLVATAATFYSTSGGDGGPGQMGYATPGADQLFGEAFTSYFQRLESETDDPVEAVERLQVALEGAANIPHEELQQKLIHYSLNGPEHLRTIAASSVSDPRSAQLVAVPEMIEPLVQQVQRGAFDPPRRTELSDPIIKLFGRVRWMVPTNEEQQREILDYLIPDLDGYVSERQIEQIDDPARREEVRREMEAKRYLAEELGDVFGENPDLQFAAVLDRFPTGEVNPLEARFWLPSVPWILTSGMPLPQVGESPAPAAGDGPADGPGSHDPLDEVRRACLRLYLDQLQASAEPATRRLAVDMAHAIELRSRPEVLVALRNLPEYETNALALKRADDVLDAQQELRRQLLAAVRREDPPRVPRDADGEVQLPPEFVEDFRFFRDHVIAEMNRPQRIDQQSCFSCHGVPGRVPPLTLHPPNSVGYLSVGRLLENYRLLQERIDYEQGEKSKLLRKPLNIQTGEEDGHQGGIRYRPMDRGYLVLKTWVENQVRQREQVGLEPLGE